MRRVLALPTGSQVQPADIGRICGLLRILAVHGQAIKARLADPAVATRRAA